MKVTVSNTFDISQVADTKSYKELEPFFDYFNQLTSDVVLGLNKQLTVSDNVKAKELNLTLQHGIPVNIGQYNPVFTYLRTESQVSSYKLTSNADSTKSLTVYFKGTQNVFAKEAIWQSGTVVRYKITGESSLSPGEVVVVAGFGTQANNGTFLITEVDTTNHYIYVINRNRTSSSGDENKTGYSGGALLKYNVVLGLILP